jgi:transcriptional regulator with XRE-family HTH domain
MKGRNVMSDQIKQIAVRIKEIREISGLSLDELSKEFDISKSKYEEYESGKSDIPVSFLYEIANRFDVELTSLLTGDAPRLSTYSLVRKGKGINVERREQYEYQSLAFNFIHKKVEPFLVTVKSGNIDEPIHFNTHPGQEFNYMIEGSMKVVINDSEIDLNEGDSLYFDSTAKHGMKSLNGKPAKFLAIIF